MNFYDENYVKLSKSELQITIRMRRKLQFYRSMRNYARTNYAETHEHLHITMAIFIVVTKRNVVELSPVILFLVPRLDEHLITLAAIQFMVFT